MEVLKMKKSLKKVVAILLSLVLMSSYSFNAFASNNKSITENVLQDALEMSNIDADPIQLDSMQYDEKWNEYFSEESSVRDFLKQVEMDGFVEDIHYNDLAANVVDNNSDFDFYYYFKVYNNDKNEKVYAMFIEFPDSNTIPTVYAIKSGEDNQAIDYYNYIDTSPKQLRLTKTDWICQLGSEFACTVFAKMLFELGAIAGLIGVGCDIIFFWACGNGS